METRGELTQQEFKETWIVKVGKKDYELNEKQIVILKEADLQGQRGIVWFDGFAISIPHIESIYLVERYLPQEKYWETLEEVKSKDGKTISYKIIKHQK